MSGCPMLRLIPLAALLAACAAPDPQADASASAPASVAAAATPEEAARRWFAAVSQKIVAQRYDPRDPADPLVGPLGAARAIVHFSVDAVGRIRAPEVRESSGQPKLDAAAAIMVMAAQPLPPPPPQLLKDGLVPMAVPVQFAARQRQTAPALMGPK